MTLVRRWVPLATVGLLLAACSIAPPAQPSPEPSAPVEPTVGPTIPPSALTVTEAIARRDAGQLGGDRFLLHGYWSTRVVHRSCSPQEIVIEFEPGCGDTDYGITEANEPILEFALDQQVIPTSSPVLHPFVDVEHAEVLFGLRPFGSLPHPPVPIVVEGHFDDPRAADCRPERAQACREQFVIDELVVFDPASVPAPTPTPSPTPFPSPPPAPLFLAQHCAGDVAYSFVGWATDAELQLAADPPGHLFAMVTAEPVPLGGWSERAPDGDRWRMMARKICVSEDIYVGYAPGTAPIGYDHVPGTMYRQWESGRIEPISSP